jgi:hypothetical protein
MTALALRSIGSNDYAVLDDGHPVGRIRHAAERTNEEVWLWNITIPVPGGGNGTSPSLDHAKAAFRDSWFKFKKELGPERLASALETAEAAREQS